jgi:uncharacterized phage protein (TIGR01671 family)
MREIKFRGKSRESVEFPCTSIEKGDWIEGFYCYSYGDNETKIITRIQVESGGVGSGLAEIEISVFPETVEQYTGLKDKNGKEIFEGDILLSRSVEVLDGSDDIQHVVAFNTTDYNAYFDFGYCKRPAHCEVIGNTHENPELLSAPLAPEEVKGCR